MALNSNTYTEKSPRHESNEDGLYCKGNIAIVADGMGGEAAGEMASKLAVEAISAHLESKLKNTNCLNSEFVKAAINEAITKADNAILEYIDKNPEAFGMGTTVTVAVIDGHNLFIGWCGDSRCYKYVNKTGLKCYTKDHSYVQELIDKGEITVAESYSHPDSNVITRYVGGGAEYCQPEFTSTQFTDDDTMLLCTDGLSGYCTNEEITNVIANYNGKGSLSEALAQAAKTRGSDDDITIIVLGNLKARKKSGFFSWLK